MTNVRSRLYEGMFLLNNDTVRAGWKAAKKSVVDLVKKHGGKVLAARRWEERRLAYPIRGRRRATYLVTYYELEPAGIPRMIRELDISELVLRYLLTTVEALPAGEAELAAAEDAEGFVVPEPPSDDADDRALEEAAAASAAAESDDADEDSDDDSDSEKSADEPALVTASSRAGSRSGDDDEKEG